METKGIVKFDPIVIATNKKFYETFRTALGKSKLSIDQLKLLAAHLKVQYDEDTTREELISSIADKAHLIVEDETFPLFIKSTSVGISFLFLKFLANALKRPVPVGGEAPKSYDLLGVEVKGEDIFNSLLLIAAAFFRSSKISNWISKVVRSDYDFIENIDVYLNMIQDEHFNVDYQDKCNKLGKWDCIRGKSKYCTFDILERKCRPKKRYQLIQELAKLQKGQMGQKVEIKLSK